MISSLPTYSVFISVSSEKEKKYVSKDKSNRKFRTEKKSVLIVFSMLNDKTHLFAGHKYGCYYLMAGALFVQCFSFLFFIFHGILLVSKFLVCIHFPADGCENLTTLRKK